MGVFSKGEKDTSKAHEADDKKSDAEALDSLPRKQAPMHLNRETANEPDQAINPHNEALAQRPAEDTNERLREAEKDASEPIGRLRAWRQQNFLGGPSSAAWEEFDKLIDELDKPAKKTRTTAEKK